MDLYNKGAKLEDILQENLPIEAKVNVLFDVLKNVLDEGAIRARTIRFKLQKYVNSSNINERIYALDVIASDGNGAKVVPADDELEKALEDVLYWISENIAKKYVQNKIEADVEKALVERQDKFMDELRVSIIKKQKGKENTKTTAKLERLEKLGFSHMPICMAKTQYSLTDDQTKLGRPTGFRITVRQLTVSAGAGFIVALTGAIMKMPGLPKVPAANKIDIDNNGVITGLF